MSRKLWTEDEIQFLREHYLEEGIEWCAQRLGRTKGTTRQKAYCCLGLKFYSKDDCSGEKNPFYGRTHTEESRRKIGEATRKRGFLGKRVVIDDGHIEFIKRYYADKGRKWCADRLPYYEKRVQLIARELGLRVSKECFSRLCSWTGPKRRYPRSQAYRDACSRKYSGSGNPRWKGGVTPEIELRLRTPEWRRISDTVRTRDDNTCRRCGSKQPNNWKCAVHHIVPERLGGTDDVDNLICLCSRCHGWADTHLEQSTPELQEIVRDRDYPPPTSPPDYFGYFVN